MQLVCGNGALKRSLPDALGAVALDPLGGKRSANTETATDETQIYFGDLPPFLIISFYIKH